VLFFFSGLHSDYHRPTDTWEKINETDAATLLKLVHEATDRLAAAGTRPEYVRFTPPAPQGAPGSGSRGYGADFGSIPDFAEVPDGFRIADVRPGSPAEKGGVKAGDIMFEFDGKPVKNLMDYSLLLRAKKPGDAVAVKVRRGGEVKELSVTLGVRSR
jgi:S1-C subfamily serine protease